MAAIDRFLTTRRYSHEPAVCFSTQQCPKKSAQFGVVEAIRSELNRRAAKQNLKVLFAIESGSRAWGFASPDSDYDVRFIYLRPRDWYLSVSRGRDVVEAMLEPDLDFAGWDLTKALLLLKKSNPSLLEWLGSPIVYRQDEAFVADFRELASRCTSLPACFRHYLHMAEGNWRAYFGGEQVLLKKYLYVLRPVLACRWIELHQSFPPVAFEVLRAGSEEPADVRTSTDELLRIKAVTSELGTGPRRNALDRFMTSEIERLQAIKQPAEPTVPNEDLDQFFRKWVGAYNLTSG